MMRTKLLVVSSCCLAATLAHVAIAEPTADEKAAAEQLFEDGKRLLGEGKYAAACQKLESSQRLDAGIGTLLYLADCYEKSGRVASAWATFREAAAAARAGNQADREQKARARASALEPKLFKLSLEVADAGISGLEIRRNGTVVKREVWGSPVPVDPGKYTLEVTAPGRKRVDIAVEVPDGPGNKTVTIPALEVDPNAPAVPTPSATNSVAPPPTPTTAPTSPPAPDAPKSGSSLKTIGFVTAGVGVLGLGVAGVLSGLAASKNSAADKFCKGTTCTDQQGVDLGNQAKGFADGATIALIAGATFAAAGVVLVIAAPSSASSASAHLTPSLGPSFSGLTLRGSL